MNSIERGGRRVRDRKGMLSIHQLDKDITHIKNELSALMAARVGMDAMGFEEIEIDGITKFEAGIEEIRRYATNAALSVVKMRTEHGGRNASLN